MQKNFFIWFYYKTLHFISLAILIFGIFFVNVNSASAEGSRETVANGGINRPLTEWRTSIYGNLLRRRTFFQVYARAGEVINLGSSAIGLGQGDIALWQPGLINDFDTSQKLFNELPTPSLRCASAQPGKGLINSRELELAGPLPNSAGYDPCVYSVTTTGIHWVAFFGPDGAQPATDHDGNAGTIASPNVGITQNTGVSIWDITVRSSNSTGFVEYPGRVFTNYLAQLMNGTGINNRIYASLYIVTQDGFQYKVDLDGLDPYGYIIYANDIGYLNPDGSPLYHNLVASDSNLTTPQGSVTLAHPNALIFFSPPAPDLPNTIVTVPQVPTLQNITFIGAAGGNKTYTNLGGQFSYHGNVGGITEIIISRDNSNFDPTNPQNRVLRSVSLAGQQTIFWDGLDNSGQPFPNGAFNYRVSLHAGEYHFPMLDTENSTLGAPRIQTLNPPNGICPLGCTTAFYDDRGYRTSNGSIIGTLNETLPGDTPPIINRSDPDLGFDTSSNQRAYGNNGNNGFGNNKGLDLWTFYPSETVSQTLTVIPAINRDMAVSLTHTGDFEIGSMNVYQAIVTNRGTQNNNRQTTLTINIPNRMNIQDVRPNGWSCNTIGQQITCEITQTTAPGQSLPIVEVTVLPEEQLPPIVIANATISNSRDNNPDNNTANDETRLLPYDYGDLPSSYPTTLAQDGPRHLLGNLYLGSLIDAENNTINSPGIHDNDVNNNDEDGIQRENGETWQPGNTVHLNVTVQGTGGHLIGWFDWNSDGDLNDTDEMIRFGNPPQGTSYLDLIIPPSYTTGQTIYARFRLYAGYPETPLPYGKAINGEVEDYEWRFSPTAITLSDFKANPQSSTTKIYWFVLGSFLLLSGLLLRSKRQP
jgi:hypothetical protein